MLIRNVELDGRLQNVRCRDGRVSEMGLQLAPNGDEGVIDAGGGGLLPGLHDHHIHLYAEAAAQDSLDCGPPAVVDAEQLAGALQFQHGQGWLRGVGYHESVAGDLNRYLLDQWLGDRPARVQHRSGKMWILNSAAMEKLGVEQEAEQTGIERDSRGRATGRLFRMDTWLRERMANQSPPSIAALSQKLAAFGVTGVTDAGASNSAAEMAQFQRLVDSGELCQRLMVMGDAQLPVSRHSMIQRGALKILLDDHRLPDYAQLLSSIRQAGEQGRGVAIHCVTRTELVFALTALTEQASGFGDRIEHASVTPGEVLPMMRELGVTVVTQPGFLYGRGDQYLRDVVEEEQPMLYRGSSFIEAGIALAGSSDAPYGSVDPWLAMRAAVQRQTRSGKVIGAGEALTPEQALALFTAPADAPGAEPRRIAVGATADLCLLNKPWAEARHRLDGNDVLATLCAGKCIYRSS